MTKIQIPYLPRIWAKKLHDCFKRFFSLIIHRRGGKTVALVNHLQRAATDDEWETRRLRYLAPNLTNKDIQDLLRDRNYGLVLPTYTQAETVAWKMLKYYSAPIPGIKTNEQKLSVLYPNGATLRLFGADNPDSLRGTAFSGLGFDEYSQQPSNIFSEVLSKSLADHLGFAIFGGTIKGKNQLFRTHEVAKTNPNEWGYIWQDIDVSLATEEGATIKLLRIALEDDKKFVAQKMMTEEEFLQEWYLSPEAAIKGAYYTSLLAKARKENRIKFVPHDPALPVHTVWDLGKGPNMAVGFFQKLSNEMRWIDAIEGEVNEAMPEVIAKVLKKPYVFGKHFAPHDIKHTEIATGKTRLDTAAELGIKFEVVPSVSVNDGIDRAKIMFGRLYICEVKCILALDALAQYRRQWDEVRGMFKENPYHDWTSHFADVLRMAALVEDQMYVDINKAKVRQPHHEPINEFDIGTINPNAGSSIFIEDML